ncbi:hypothetical protein F0U61_07910 [Archangium violaceum]|uniref:hypothetical protein n=1 Tax=Archangium violaceum TaxID=83451 RepID=UPI002B2DA28F|nr:hypothetical protein F0U61_07910 [Archangium violaceum]
MSQMDFKALAGHILNPSRPRLAEARAVVEGCDDPGAAWERLVREGMVPAEWREDPRRVFMSLCEACGGMSVIIEYPSARNDAELCPRCKGRATLEGSHPPTVRGCVTIASAVEGIAEAEALAHRIAAAFEQRRERVVWHLRSRPESLHGTGWTRDVREALSSRYVTPCLKCSPRVTSSWLWMRRHFTSSRRWPGSEPGSCRAWVNPTNRLGGHL